MSSGVDYPLGDLLSRGSSIRGLSFPSCPSAVLGRVRAIVVDSVNCMTLGRSWPHIIKEQFKGVSPSIADRNSSASVVFPAFISAIETALLHIAPYIPFVSNGSFARMAMTKICGIFSAAAALTLSVSERCAVNILFGTAVASAAPFATFGSSQGGPATEPLSSNVDWCGH